MGFHKKFLSMSLNALSDLLKPDTHGDLKSNFNLITF
jgi:hypothetical protein